MNALLSALNRGVLFYGTTLPYHAGKWRLIEAIDKRFHLDRLYHDKAFVVRRRGITWNLRPDDLFQRSIYYCSCVEAKETRELTKLVRPDWTFFDVGAYFGYYALLVSQISKGQASVHAFEPLPANYQLLLEHKELNGFGNLHAHQVAVSDRSGEVEFRVPPASANYVGWIVGEGERPDESVRLTVRSVSLDAFVSENDIRQVDFIKIDTEGAEVNVLRGAVDTVERFRPAMMIELFPDGLSRYGRTPDELSRLIHDWGYTTYRATRTGLKRFDDFASVDMYCNVFCFPSLRERSTRAVA
jgi:FkbM family methyltransferase